MTEKYVVVIGGANIDIAGTPHKALIPADSNPGEISFSYGGVGRNIAENLCLLGVNVKLVVAVGGDVLGSDMIKHCEEVGMDTSLVLKVPEELSSMYIYINNEKGDMELAIDYQDICSRVTPEYLESIEPVINGACLVVMDGNISKEAFMKLKEICRVPIYIDPVSTILAQRIKSGLDGIDAIKPNRLEAEYLTDMTIQTEEDYRAAVRAILGMGVKKVFMSMGSEGMLAADKDNMYIVGEYPAEVVSTTGAGDAATAAIVWSAIENEGEDSLVMAAKAANVVAAMAIEVQATNNPNINPQEVSKKIKEFDMTVRAI